MTRSVGAVIAGYLIFGASAALLFRGTGMDPHVAPDFGFAVFSTVYGGVFGFVGGYVAAALAPRVPRGHALMVALLIAGVALVSAVVQWHGTSHWSQIVTVLLVAPAVVLGGSFRSRRPPFLAPRP